MLRFAVILIAVSFMSLISPGQSSSMNRSFVGVIGEELGADLLIPFTRNSCHEPDLRGDVRCKESASTNQSLQLGGVVVAPRRLANVGSWNAWYLKPGSFCPPQVADASRLPSPSAGFAKATFGPFRMDDTTMWVFNLQTAMQSVSFDVTISDLAVYSLSSRNRRNLIFGAIKNCSAASRDNSEGGRQSLYAVVGLVSGRLRFDVAISAGTMQTKGAIFSTITKALPPLFKLQPSQDGSHITVDSIDPVFFGVVLLSL